MSKELKPCPFCGSEPRVSTYETESLWSHDQVTYTKVECPECEISFHSEPGYEPEAPDAWNRRANSWASIETAPETGRRVLCWNREWQAPESGCLYGIVWAANSLAADKGGWKYQPTHWMPLPEPPTGGRMDE